MRLSPDCGPNANSSLPSVDSAGAGSPKHFSPENFPATGYRPGRCGLFIILLLKTSPLHGSIKPLSLIDTGEHGGR
jgi:hypothetical protein